VSELGFPVKKGWTQWMSPLVYGGRPQRAGYAVEYDTNDFKFVTVQGAGHMVSGVVARLMRVLTVDNVSITPTLVLGRCPRTSRSLA
jgi:hypothetical protein